MSNQPNPHRNYLSQSSQSNNSSKNSSRFDSSQQNANQQCLKAYKEQNTYEQGKTNQYKKQSLNNKSNQSQSFSSQQSQISIDQIIQQNKRLKQDQKNSQKQIRGFLQQSILDQDKLKFYQERQKKYSSSISQLQCSHQQLNTRNQFTINQLRSKNYELQRRIQQLQEISTLNQQKLAIYVSKYSELLQLSMTTSDKYQTQLINSFNRTKFIQSEYQKFKVNLTDILTQLPKQQQINLKANEFNTKVTNIKNIQTKIKQILNLILFKNSIQKIVDSAKLQNLVAEVFTNLGNQSLNIQNNLSNQNQMRKSVMKGIGLNMFFVLEELKINLKNKELGNVESNYTTLLQTSEFLMTNSE